MMCYMEREKLSLDISFWIKMLTSQATHAHTLYIFTLLYALYLALVIILQDCRGSMVSNIFFTAH